MDSTTEYVTIPEAARRLGLSRSAVRRRLTAGRLRGRQEQRPQGLLWLVAFPTEPDATSPDTSRHVAHATSRDIPDGDATSRDIPDGDATSRHVAPEPAPAPTTLPVQAARAAEMASYSEQLLAPYIRRIEEQAERLGRLELELEQARARVAELELIPIGDGQAGQEDAPPAESQAGRSWWRRLVWG